MADDSQSSAFAPTHRHYKGGLYQKLVEARHSETLEWLVIYRNEAGDWWARPKEMFEEVAYLPSPDLEEGQMRNQPRFALLPASEPTQETER